MSETVEKDDTLAVAMAELRPSLEAILMVADQPLDQVTLASAVGYPVEEVAAALADLAGEYAAQGRGFELRVGGRGLAVLHPRGVRRRSSRRSSSTASRPGSPRPRWRRWRWSPTSSRSPGPGSPRSAASTSTA